MFLSESTRFYRSRPPSIWPEERRKRSDLIEDKSSKTQPGEFGRCAQGQKVIFSGELGIFVVSSPMMWPVLVEYEENLFCHLWRNFPVPFSFSPQPGNSRLPPVGSRLPGQDVGDRGAHSSSPPASKHMGGYPHSREFAPIFQKTLDNSAPDMRAHPTKSMSSGTVAQLFSHRWNTDDHGSPKTGEVLSSLRGGEIQNKQQPKEERNLLP